MGLRYNEHGGVIVRQSDLSSWARCQLQKKYRDEDATPRQLSATVYGTVVHYALLTLEKLHHAGSEHALDTAISTFEHYWHPENVGLINDGRGVDTWLPRQTYGGLRERGRMAIRSYYEALVKDESKLLALEYQFSVPLPINDRLHTLTGTIDRLCVRKYYGTPYLSVDDFKTGKQPTYLRHNMQGTAYSYASTQPQFWVSDLYPSFDQEVLDGIEKAFAKMGLRLHEGTRTDWWTGAAKTTVTQLASRRFRWINLQEIKFVDGGWRGPLDYERLKVAVEAYIASVEAGIYSPALAGEVCMYCEYQKICGGVGIPEPSHGVPTKRYAPKKK